MSRFDPGTGLQIRGWLIVLGARMAFGIFALLGMALEGITGAYPILASSGYVFWRFVTRSSRFVQDYILVNVAFLGFLYAADLIANGRPSPTFAGALIGEGIVFAYLLKSERVNRTFVY